MPPRKAATRASARLAKTTARSKRDEEDYEEEEEEEQQVRPTRRVARRAASKKKQQSSEEEEETTPEEEPVRRRAKRKAAPRRKKQSSEDEDEVEEEDEGEEEEEEQESAPKRQRLARKAKEVKGGDEEEEEDGKSAPAGKWTSVDTMLLLDSPDTKPSAKIASFDMDDTLITTKSGRAFPTGRADWVWWDEKVPEKLKELHKDGFKLVIFTNQAGISKGHSKAKDIQGKILDLSAALGLPLQAFVATTDDKWRKPSTGMWDYFVEHHNGGVAVDMSQSFYCGDAAGRAKAWDGNAKTKKDHSCSDRKFAHNAGLPFHTPEMLFFGHKDVAFAWGSIDPTSIPKTGKAYEGELTSDSQEMIICVGFPASGKSTFARRYLVPKGYVHVNQDTLKSKAGCLKGARAAIEEGKSVVIDNTNPSASVRAEYIAIANDHEIPVRCFVFLTPIELAQHMNSYRENVFGVKHVPGVGYNMYKKNFKAPHKSEGFTEIKEINFVPHFDDPEKEKLFYRYT